MSRTGKKIAVVDYGYDVVNVGQMEFMLGWKRLLEPVGWEVDFFYLEDRFNRLRVGEAVFPCPVWKWYEVSQLEGYDFVIFNCMGKQSRKDPSTVLADMVLRLRNPVCIFIFHDRGNVRHNFRNVLMRPLYTYAFDYTLTYAPKMFEKGGVPSERVRSIGLWHHWKRMEDGVNVRLPAERPFTVSYAARLARWKGVFQAYDFFERLHQADPRATFRMHGWTGFIGEAKIRKRPANIMDVRKDGMLRPNSPEAFVRFCKANYDQQFIYQAIADSQYSWCAIESREGIEERWVSPTFEGSTLVALRCGTVPIVSGISRQLDVLGTPLEVYRACLFVDDGHTDWLAKHFLSSDHDHEAQYRRTADFARMFFDPDRFRRAIIGTLEELRETGYQPRCKVKELKFNRIDPDRNILDDYYAERREAGGR